MNASSQRTFPLPRPRKGRPARNAIGAHGQPTPRERGRLAYTLRREGLGWREVAEALGYAAPAAAVMAAQRYERELQERQREAQRLEMIAQLEALYAIVGPKAATGDPAWIEREKRLIGQMVRLLNVDPLSPIAKAYPGRHNTPAEDAELDRLLDDQVPVTPQLLASVRAKRNSAKRGARKVAR